NQDRDHEPNHAPTEHTDAPLCHESYVPQREVPRLSDVTSTRAKPAAHFRSSSPLFLPARYGDGLSRSPTWSPICASSAFAKSRSSAGGSLVLTASTFGSFRSISAVMRKRSFSTRFFFTTSITRFNVTSATAAASSSAYASVAVTSPSLPG